MALDDRWYTEIWADQGSAISLRTSEKLFESQSAYQLIEIFQTEKFGRLMTLDGLVMVTERDHFIYHEMLIHPALFSRPDPRRCVIVGGGDCGALTEAVKHPGLESIIQVELDEAVTEAALRYFPDFQPATRDPRVELHFTDGIRWLEQAPGQSCDVIVIDSTDPVGPAEGLFSADFFRACRTALSENGVLVIQSESPLFHADLIRSVRERLRQVGFADAASLHFPQCTYPSGWWSATLGVKRGKAADFDEEASRARGFSTRYYNPGIHQAAFAQPEFLQSG